MVAMVSAQGASSVILILIELAISMDTTYEDLRADDTCTSCEVTQDNSAYWTPTLHFMWNNGTAEMVDQVGGMLA